MKLSTDDAACGALIIRPVLSVAIIMHSIITAGCAASANYYYSRHNGHI